MSLCCILDKQFLSCGELCQFSISCDLKSRTVSIPLPLKIVIIDRLIRSALRVTKKNHKIHLESKKTSKSFLLKLYMKIKRFIHTVTVFSKIICAK